MLNQPGIAIQPFLYVAMLYNPFYMLLDGVCIFVIKEHVERTHEQKPKDRNAGRRWDGWRGVGGQMETTALEQKF